MIKGFLNLDHKHKVKKGGVARDGGGGGGGGGLAEKIVILSNL